MNGRSKALPLFLLMILCVPIQAGASLKIFLDETRKESIEAEELDCRTYERKAGITLGFKVGTFAFDMGPEITLGKKETVEWDKSVHDLLAKYKELCSRFNAGAITMKEYNDRIEKLDTLAREMMEFQQKQTQRVKDESKDAFRELESETRREKPADTPETSEKLNDIKQKLGELP